MGIQYGNGFEDFRKQAILLFPGMDFSQVQINTLVLVTPFGSDVPGEEEVDLQEEEVVSLEDKGANKPKGKDIDEQPTNPIDDLQA